MKDSKLKHYTHSTAVLVYKCVKADNARKGFIITLTSVTTLEAELIRLRQTSMFPQEMHRCCLN